MNENKPNLTHPMQPHEQLCAAMELTLPPLEPLSGDAVPQPYRQLLVHERDMTPTLEAYHDCTLSLRVIRKAEIDGCLVREVLLISDRADQPVAFGVIRIFLDTFDERTRQLILDCRKPLGSILASQAIDHFSRPVLFFSLQPDDTVRSTFDLSRDAASRLYGRYNELFHEPDRRLAQVLEIMAPTQEKA